jgi:ribonuclease D
VIGVPQATHATPQVLATEGVLREVLRRVGQASRVAVDLEASGMFTHRARICAIQLAWDPGEVAVVDTLAVDARGLGPIASATGPLKIVHDVAFDARLLAEIGIELGNVHDTALAARMLGRASTGLASLLEAELGVTIAKDMQRHDWRERPLSDPMLAYLAQDVTFLAALDDKLWGEVTQKGIADEVLEETQYRLATAVQSVRCPDTTPPYARIKGVERLAEREVAVLRLVAQLREEEASRRDVPPYRVASNDALLTIARERPKTPAQAARTRGIPREHPCTPEFADALVRAVALAGETRPPEELARFERPKLPAAVVRAKREREGRLLAWRREEAKRRGVDEQVVLPGHCAKDLVEMSPQAAEDLRSVRGIGAFRIDRYGAAITQALRGAGGDEVPAGGTKPPATSGSSEAPS